eukprot:m.51745 g.51745  ORF g.51745 m.51745 type:complete len:185 (+) comp10962_c0_seq3:771-1325(+)
MSPCSSKKDHQTQTHTHIHVNCLKQSSVNPLVMFIPCVFAADANTNVSSLSRMGSALQQPHTTACCEEGNTSTSVSLSDCCSLRSRHCGHLIAFLMSLFEGTGNSAVSEECARRRCCFILIHNHFLQTSKRVDVLKRATLTFHTPISHIRLHKSYPSRFIESVALFPRRKVLQESCSNSIHINL